MLCFYIFSFFACHAVVVIIDFVVTGFVFKLLIAFVASLRLEVGTFMLAAKHHHFSLECDISILSHQYLKNDQN